MKKVLYKNGIMVSWDYDIRQDATVFSITVPQSVKHTDEFNKTKVKQRNMIREF